MEVLIVGAGAIGKWFGAMIDDPIYTDLDQSQATAAATATDGTTAPPDETLLADLVCIAVPMTDAEQSIQTYAPKASDALIDLTGAMAGPIDAMKTHAPTLERASFHPLFAPENAPGRIAAVIDNHGPTIDSVRTTFTTHGNTVFDTTPTEHDTAMETIQAKTHTAILAFALAASDVPPEYGTPVYDQLAALVEEVTTGTPRVYADIQDTFDGATDIAHTATQLANATRAEFEQLYREAGE